MKKIFALLICCFLILSCFVFAISADSAITDLTGATVIFNPRVNLFDFPEPTPLYLEFSVVFLDSSVSDYYGFYFDYDSELLYVVNSDGSHDLAYDGASWFGDRIFVFTGGDDVTNPDFIRWVVSNGTVYGSNNSPAVPDVPEGIYNGIYDLIADHVFGGTVAPGSVQFLACTLISVIACVFIVFLPFIIVWRVIRFICG